MIAESIRKYQKLRTSMSEQFFSSQYECIVDSITEGENVLMHGPGGTGKSYTLCNLLNEFSLKKAIACTALTGVAAANLRAQLQAGHAEGGPVEVRTLHSWSGVGTGCGTKEQVWGKVKRNKRAFQRWMVVEILFIDEVSMLGDTLFGKLDYVARCVRKAPSLPFGGIQVVVSGDVLQLPPVRDGWVFRNPLWTALELVPYNFEECRRYGDLDFFNLLLRARRGELVPRDEEQLESRAAAYRDEAASLVNPENGILPTVLFPFNVETKAYNDVALQRLGRALQVYGALDSLETASSADRKNLIKQFDHIVPQRLSLCVGAQVMLKANLDVNAGLVNGARGVVVELLPGTARVLFQEGPPVLIAPFVWTIEQPSAPGRGPRVRKHTRSQLPLILAWALTIHRAQACTLDFVVCDLGPSIFTPGQAYVALSRVRSLESLYLSQFTSASVYADQDALRYSAELKAAEPVEYTD